MSELTIPTPWVVRTQEQFEAVKAAAAADNHQVLAPTHAFRLGDTIVASASIGSVPTVHLWADSKSMNARRSLCCFRMVETFCQTLGYRAILVPCAENSPFYPFMPKLGFTRLGTSSLNLKAL